MRAKLFKLYSILGVFMLMRATIQLLQGYPKWWASLIVGTGLVAAAGWLSAKESHREP